LRSTVTHLEARERSAIFLEYGWALALNLFWPEGLPGRDSRFSRHAIRPDTIFLIGSASSSSAVRFIFDHHDLNPELYEARFAAANLYRLACLPSPHFSHRGRLDRHQRIYGKIALSPAA